MILKRSFISSLNYDIVLLDRFETMLLSCDRLKPLDDGQPYHMLPDALVIIHVLDDNFVAP